MKTFLLRLFFVSLTLYNGLLAWAGLEAARGKVLLDSKNYAGAIQAFEGALKTDPFHPETLFRTGVSYWERWLNERKAQDLETARFYFDKTLRFHPQYAKARYYAALSEKQVLQQQGKWTGEDRERNRAAFRTARHLEPYSPWMVIHSLLEIYGNAEALTEREKKDIVRQMRTALSWHYRHQTSPYLLPVYERWWMEFGDPQLLRRVTPKESLSYFRFLEFLKSKKAWSAYASVYPAYARLNRRFYREIADEADVWLGRNSLERAGAAYAFARRQRPFAARAEAGLLASGTGALTEEEKTRLKRVLIQDEENIGFYLDGIAARMNGYFQEDPYVRGLLAWRQGKVSQAVSLLEKAPADLTERRRLLAQAYLEQGSRDKAAEILQAVLSEPRADMRELFLLQRLADIEHVGPADEIHAAISTARTRRLEDSDWRFHSGEKASFLSPGEYAGTEVNLQPGRVRLKIWFKTEENAQGLVRLSLWEKDRRQYESPSAVSVSGGLSVWNFETTGGWRWLQIEFPSENNEPGRALFLRLGPGRLDYPE